MTLAGEGFDFKKAQRVNTNVCLRQTDFAHFVMPRDREEGAIQILFGHLTMHGFSNESNNKPKL